MVESGGINSDSGGRINAEAMLLRVNASELRTRSNQARRGATQPIGST